MKTREEIVKMMEIVNPISLDETLLTEIQSTAILSFNCALDWVLDFEFAKSVEEAESCMDYLTNLCKLHQKE